MLKLKKVFLCFIVQGFLLLLFHLTVYAEDANATVYFLNGMWTVDISEAFGTADRSKVELAGTEEAYWSYDSATGLAAFTTSYPGSVPYELNVVYDEREISILLRARDGWARKGDQVYYYKGGKPLTGFQTLDDVRYHFDRSGELDIGWFVDGGKTYYGNTSAKNLGEIGTGWLKTDGMHYYLSPDLSVYGQAVKGFVTIDGSFYHFDDFYELDLGWITVNGETYYASPEGKNLGAIVGGWLRDNGNYYYHSIDKPTYGQRCTGFVMIGKSLYYFNSKGILSLGWFTVDGNRYYASPATATRGEIATGWLKMDGKTYYMMSQGQNLGLAVTGFYSIAGVRYHFNENGEMNTGWFKDNGYTYYADKSKAQNGKVMTGWVRIDGKEYYFSQKKESLGRMATGKVSIGKHQYYTNKNGSKKTGFVTLYGKTYYFSRTTGRQVKHKWFTDRGCRYFADKKGVIAKNRFVYSNGKKNTIKAKELKKITYRYYVDKKGRKVTSKWIKLKNGKKYYADSKGRIVKK